VVRPKRHGSTFSTVPNILFIVVVGVFWAIGGLVKVASNKSRKQGASRPSSDGRKRETWLQQLAKKAQDIKHAIEREGSKEQPHYSYRPQEHPIEASRPPFDLSVVYGRRHCRPVRCAFSIEESRNRARRKKKPDLARQLPTITFRQLIPPNLTAADVTITSTFYTQ
jgi:hypothetical protein